MPNFKKKKKKDQLNYVKIKALQHLKLFDHLANKKSQGHGYGLIGCSFKQIRIVANEINPLIMSSGICTPFKWGWIDIFPYMEMCNILKKDPNNSKVQRKQKGNVCLWFITSKSIRWMLGRHRPYKVASHSIKLTRWVPGRPKKMQTIP